MNRRASRHAQSAAQVGDDGDARRAEAARVERKAAVGGERPRQRIDSGGGLCQSANLAHDLREQPRGELVDPGCRLRTVQSEVLGGCGELDCQICAHSVSS